MAINKEAERTADAAKIDKAIDAMLDILKASVPKSGDQEVDDLNALVLGKSKTEAAKALPALFLRRSALLGLDEQAPGDKTKPAETGTLAELDRRLAMVR